MPTTSRRHPRRRRLFSVVAVLLSTVLGLPLLTAPAVAADPEYLSLTKTVDRSELAPGDTYTYRVQVTCSEQSCLDAVLTDSLAEHAGHEVRDVRMRSSDPGLTFAATWTSQGAQTGTAPAVVAADTRVDVAFTQTTVSPAGTGMQSGQTFTLEITLAVPTDLPPGTDVTLENSATVTATNSAPAVDVERVHVVVPVVVDVTPAKSWTPADVAFAPGAASTVRVGVGNAANVPADALVLQDPAVAPEGATSLDAANPFTLVDLTSLDAVAVPTGCVQVTVDAYVLRDGAWTWVAGAGGLALPDGVTAGDVAGLRVTCAGPVPVGATMTLDLGVAQRTTHRESGADLSRDTHSIVNAVAASVQVAGHDDVTRTATAPYRVTPARLGTELTKAFTRARVTGGETSVLTLDATQTSEVPVAELRVEDLGFFDDEIRFGGFASAPQWPTGADGATVVYHLSDGTTQDVTFTTGTVPDAPTLATGVHVTGFAVVFTGSIAPAGDPARLAVDVVTDDEPDAPVRTRDNDALATVVAPNGNTAEGPSDARLTVLPASIDVTLDKTVRPGTALRPGDTAVVELRTGLSVSSSYVTADRVVVTDAWDGTQDGFWNAFELTAIAPTQVPSGTSVQLDVQTSVGTWTTLVVEPARAASWVLEVDAAALGSAGVTLGDVTGVRLTFVDADGFEESTTLVPYVVTTARGTLRTGGALPQDGAALQNAALAAADGSTDGGRPVEGDDPGDDGVDVTPVPPGTGPVEIDKTWSAATVAAQSGQRRTTALTWRTTAGASSVTISDPASTTEPLAGSVFDAFDLVAVRPVALSSTPYSNGWYLRYDRVTDVQLYLPDGAGGYAWTSVQEPAGGWVTSSGFVGLTLDAQQQADARAVRVVLAENTAARAAARQAGDAYDPFAPAPGSGVAAASTDRVLTLEWQVRQVRRTGGWVTGSALYGAPDTGVVRNRVGIEAQLATGTSSDQDHADIRLTDATPLVRIDKRVSTSDVAYVPRPGVVDAADWPTRTFTVEAWNDSVARASYVRVSDPACSDVDVQDGACVLTDPTADPFGTDVDWLAPGTAGSVFDRFDLTDVEITTTRADEVDLAASTAWLLHLRDGDLVVERTTAAALVGMPPAQLADVVGVSVTFQGTQPQVTGGTITQGNRLGLVLSTRLRTHVRSTGVAQTLAAGRTLDVENHAYAQSYDPVLDPDGDTIAAGTDDATVPLTGGDINVGVTKDVTPSTVTEPARGEPLTVTLTADRGVSPVGTLAPAEVVLTDDSTTSPEFWDEFDLVGVGDVTLPAGADQVRVDLYGPFGTDGELVWVEGSAGTGTPVLPVAADRLDDVQGVRYVVSRADGAFFSTQVPAAAWTMRADFQVRLRDTTRGTGDPIELDDEHTVTNTVVAVADRLNGERSVERARSAVVTLSEGTHRLAVSKIANDGDRTVDVGTSVPWDLAFRNDGTGYLTVAELRDTLPASLVWTGETQPVVSVPAGAAISEDVTVTRDGADLVLTWPQDARTLAPGESVGVRLMLELQPGLSEGDRAVNTMTVRTAQTLDACTPLDPSSPVTGAWTQDATTCGASDHVSPRGGPNLFTVKGVRGAASGAATTSGQECLPLLDATGGAYYRTPCVARSVVGGQDDWVLRVVNGGTTSVDELTIFDPLAATGDTMIISGLERGSTYRPRVVAGSLQVHAPAGATVVTEVTTTASACAGTWAGLTTGAVCEQSGEQWQPVDGSTDWDAVTALRVRVDLRTSAGGALLSGQHVDVTFSTVNVLSADDVADGVPAGTAADDVVAWNQFGVKYRDQGASDWKKIAPDRMGVEVLTGPLEVVKVVDGPAAALAPTVFAADLVCRLDGVTLDLGAAASLTLDAANGYRARVDGIPVGARCDVTEAGVPGDRGEAVRSGAVSIEVDAPATDDGGVVGTQVATITNTYRYGTLSVTKRVDTEATTGLPGTYGFALTCTAAGTGAPVLFDGASELGFELADGDTFTAPAGVIPQTATCTVRETDDGGADRVTLVGDGVVPTGPGAADVVIGATHAQVEVVNGFDAGVLVVRKEVAGDGAATWGASATFGFSAVCTDGGRTLLDERFELAAGGVRTFGTFPAGTSCQVLEVATGGATSSSVDPVDGVVTIDAPAGADTVSTALVTVTNTFDLTSLDVVKRVEGDTSVEGAQGPFEVALACTWTVDGQDVALDVPGGATRTLRAPAALTATWAGLPVGADCVLTETRTGGASQVSATVRVDGRDAVASTGARVPVVGLAGTTAPGQAVVELVNTFEAAADTAAEGTDVDPLAITGADALRAGLVAVLLLVAGGLLLVVGRRRA